MIVTFYSHNLFFFPGPPHLISCLLFLQPWEQLPKQGFWEGSGTDSVLPCWDFWPCLSSSPCALPACPPDLCWGCWSHHGSGAKVQQCHWTDPQGPSLQECGYRTGHICTSYFLGILLLPLLPETPFLCHHFLSRVPVLHQPGAAALPLFLWAVVWGVLLSRLAEPHPCQQ